MNKEEAIKLLEHISIAYTPTDAYGDYDDPQPYEEAIDMAIEALQKDIERREMVIRASERHLGIVRCKDCKWFNHVGCAIRIVDDSDEPTENDFCSFGERRTKNSEAETILSREECADLWLVGAKVKPEVKITETDMIYVGENYKV